MAEHTLTSAATTTIGVVGAGAMGRGIAQVAVAAGYRTVLFDVDGEQVSAACEFIVRMLRRAA
ncbi:MAG: 3-hydroxyacyl-CoA dehydrogenase NAD-binding domain-containing protein, partial [Proteobacteria bacterium]|nr:3-hydroxyacyl-CoA dehydrogenase NAD-binding domain-containing protein [Pseudomonadota bacterium]